MAHVPKKKGKSNEIENLKSTSLNTSTTKNENDNTENKTGGVTTGFSDSLTPNTSSIPNKDNEEGQLKNEVYGFVSWDSMLHYAPLATFGIRSPCTLQGILICSDPPLANSALVNSNEVKGNIALVERGGCTFPEKAKRVQEAGAIGMIVANHEMDFPTASFTMGEMESGEGSDVEIPCVMLSFQNIQSMLQYVHKTGKTLVSIELLESEQANVAIALENQQVSSVPPTHENGGLEDGVLGKFFRKSSTILKYVEDNIPLPSKGGESKLGSPSMDLKISEKKKNDDHGPLFGFLRWPKSASTYYMRYAPLAEFGVSKLPTEFSGKLVQCDPPLADSNLLKNADDLKGNIVLVKRGGCTFPEKLERLQKAGAIAAIVTNNDQNDPEAAFVMSVDHVSALHIQIPSVMVSYNVSQLLLDSLGSKISIITVTGEAAGILLANPSDLYELHPVQGQADVCRNIPPLHNACRRKEIQIVEELLLMGVSIKEQDVMHRTPLHHACAAGSLEIVDVLLKRGADPNVIDLGGQSPLHYACMSGSFACVEKLLSGNSLVTLCNMGGENPLHLACISGNAVCIESIIAANATVGENGNFVFHGLDEVDLDLCTPLHRACQYGNSDCALYLIAASASLDLMDNVGNTPLHYACKSVNIAGRSAGSLEVIERLVAAGANFIENQNGELPIDLIFSKQLRRDLEIIYLRRSMDQCRLEIKELRQDNVVLRSTMAEYVGEHITNQYNLQEASHSRQEIKNQLETQRSQIQQMQSQMTTLLQYLQNVNKNNYNNYIHNSSSSNGGTSTCSDRPFCDKSSHSVTHVTTSSFNLMGYSFPNTSFPNTSFPFELGVGNDHLGLDKNSKEIESEGERAEEAALARDIGKKYVRMKDYQKAIFYFKRSLELLPLPGVQRMLDRVIASEGEAELALAHQEESRRKTETKDALMANYRQQLISRGTPPSALEAIEIEISKLTFLDEGSEEYGLARDWLDWLTSLPWQGTSASEQPPQLYGVNILQKLIKDVKSSEDAMEDPMEEHENQKDDNDNEEDVFLKHQAVLVIQRIIKKRLLQKNWAALKIQRFFIQVVKQTKFSIMEDQTSECSESSTVSQGGGSVGYLTDSQHNDETVVTKDVSVSSLMMELNRKELSADQLMELVDTFVPSRVANARVVRGIKLLQPPNLMDSAIEDVKERFHILQMLELSCQEMYYVWNRWGIVGQSSQSALKGPYDLEGSVREFEKKFKEKTKNRWGVSRHKFEVCVGGFKPVTWPSFKALDFEDQEEEEEPHSLQHKSPTKILPDENHHQGKEMQMEVCKSITIKTCPEEDDHDVEFDAEDFCI